jgi:hypothetical protein
VDFEVVIVFSILVVVVKIGRQSSMVVGDGLVALGLAGGK